ncbi:hypothetical protein [Paenibacillus xanthanilyticus]|uniref:DUF6199 domain-containing protein n=1 Tax=Paenibacillus xanthanilyticus TaxID=1783531 RepID=A0ABV8JVE6_9BACL
MAQLIFIFMLMIPLFAVLVWTYLDPESSLKWGRRWMYEEEPEYSEGYLRYMKFASLAAIVFLAIVFVISAIRLWNE